jgi:hypothetical protein
LAGQGLTRRHPLAHRLMDGMPEVAVHPLVHSQPRRLAITARLALLKEPRCDLPCRLQQPKGNCNHTAEHDNHRRECKAGQHDRKNNLHVTGSAQFYLPSPFITSDMAARQGKAGKGKRQAKARWRGLEGGHRQRRCDPDRAGAPPAPCLGNDDRSQCEPGSSL